MCSKRNVVHQLMRGLLPKFTSPHPCPARQKQLTVRRLTQLHFSLYAANVHHITFKYWWGGQINSQCFKVENMGNKSYPRWYKLNDHTRQSHGPRTKILEQYCGKKSRCKHKLPGDLTPYFQSDGKRRSINQTYDVR